MIEFLATPTFQFHLLAARKTGNGITDHLLNGEEQKWLRANESVKAEYRAYFHPYACFQRMLKSVFSFNSIEKLPNSV